MCMYGKKMRTPLISSEISDIQYLIFQKAGHFKWKALHYCLLVTFSRCCISFIEFCASPTPTQSVHVLLGGQLEFKRKFAQVAMSTVSAGCEITGFLGIQDTQKHCRKPNFLTMVSDQTSCKNQGFGKQNLGLPFRNALKKFRRPNFENPIIFRNFSLWSWSWGYAVHQINNVGPGKSLHKEKSDEWHFSSDLNSNQLASSPTPPPRLPAIKHQGTGF